MKVKLKVQSRVSIPKQPGLIIGTPEYLLFLTNVPESTFIPTLTSNANSRVNQKCTVLSIKQADLLSKQGGNIQKETDTVWTVNDVLVDPYPFYSIKRVWYIMDRQRRH